MINSPAPDAPCSVVRYFQSAYPRRDSVLSRLAFRRGEDHRLRVLDGWLPGIQGLSILDSGCGDAVFLAALLSSCVGRPRLVRLEDLIPANVQAAVARIKACAEMVESDVCDSCTVATGAIHDVVLAIGILDYWADWRQRLAGLIRRSRRMTIVTLPVPRGLHYRARRIWLARHDVPLQRVSERELESALSAGGFRYQMRATRLEWVLRIDAPSWPAASAAPVTSEPTSSSQVPA